MLSKKRWLNVKAEFTRCINNELEKGDSAIIVYTRKVTISNGRLQRIRPQGKSMNDTTSSLSRPKGSDLDEEENDLFSYGLTYGYKAVNLLKGEHSCLEFLELDPLGSVPVLVDGHVVLANSFTIIMVNHPFFLFLLCL
ncbi:hypothetical protein RJT34_16809 [Clitoria ternatea]|uniref:GST N-terminal domain-containing protein n=1 Tax=Clitoria ternatea TaxID=43366 RepID=A0AAN9PE00_CLITE